MADRHEFDNKILFIIKKTNNYSYQNIELDNNSIKNCILKYFDLKLYNYDEITKLL